jgi:hypothetical protein
MSNMDEDNGEDRQLFDSLDEENTTGIEDDLMNVSGSSGGSTGEEEEMLQFIESSSNNMKNRINLLLQDIFNDDDEDSGCEWGEGSNVGRAPNKP